MDGFEPKIAQSGRSSRLLYSWKSACCSECFTDITEKSVKSHHLQILDSTNKHYVKKPRRFATKPGFIFMLMSLIVECDFVAAF